MAPEAVAPEEAQAALFAALGDDVRLHLLRRLCDQGPLSIARLTPDAGVTRQAVSKHLRVLEDAGLVSGSRLGREHVWQLVPYRLEEARYWLERISQRWDAALDRLRQHVEG